MHLFFLSSCYASFFFAGSGIRAVCEKVVICRLTEVGFWSSLEGGVLGRGSGGAPLGRLALGGTLPLHEIQKGKKVEAIEKEEKSEASSAG